MFRSDAHISGSQLVYTNCCKGLLLEGNKNLENCKEKRDKDLKIGGEG